MKQRFGVFALCAIVAVGLAPSAFATAELRLSDGTNSVDILDNGAAVCVGAVTGCVDANGSANVVTFVGTIGTWTLNVSTGSSHGASVGTDLDLNTTNSTSAASDLTIKFSDDGFAAGGRNFTVGGTLQAPAGSSLTFTEFSDAAKFGTANAIGVPLVFTVTPFSGGTGGAAAGPALTEVVVLHFTGAGSTSFNAALTPTPEPTSILLLGTLAALVGYGFRRKFSGNVA